MLLKWFKSQVQAIITWSTWHVCISTCTIPGVNCQWMPAKLNPMAINLVRPTRFDISYALTQKIVSHLLMNTGNHAMWMKKVRKNFILSVQNIRKKMKMTKKRKMIKILKMGIIHLLRNLSISHLISGFRSFSLR